MLTESPGEVETPVDAPIWCDLAPSSLYSTEFDVVFGLVVVRHVDRGAAPRQHAPRVADVRDNQLPSL